MALPYHDADLAALAVARGWVRSPAPPPGGAGWSGALAARWVGEGTLPAAQVTELLRALAGCPARCRACDARMIALPAPSSRRFPCPACGSSIEVPADPRGVQPLAGWEPRPPHHATVRLGSTTRGEGLRARTGERTERRGSEAGIDPLRDGGLRTGDVVGPYRVLRELSRGAMGVVYAAAHAELGGRPVALKVLQAWATDEEGRQRFLREGEALARVSHPNVVQVQRLGFLDDQRPYLVMTLVEGPTLEARVGEGTLPYAAAAGILAKVAEGVGALHAARLVHRDLKLANVVLRDGVEPVVLDLGLVHILDRRTRLTQAGDVLGTPLTMAPEVVRGEAELGPQVDVYALGVLLYRLVSGRYPFSGPNTEALLQAILDEPLELDPTWPRPLRAVLDRALAYEPVERYPDGGALAEDLRALASGEAVRARLPGPGRRLLRWARANPRLAAVPLMVLLASALAATGVIGLRWQAARRLRAEVAAARARADELREGIEAATPEAAGWRGEQEGLRQALERTRDERDPALLALRAQLEQALELLSRAGRREAVLSEVEASLTRAPRDLETLRRCSARLNQATLPRAPLGAVSQRYLARRIGLALCTGRAAQAEHDLRPVGELPAELLPFARAAARLAGAEAQTPDPLERATWALDAAACRPVAARGEALAGIALPPGEDPGAALARLRARALAPGLSLAQGIEVLGGLRALRRRGALPPALHARVLAAEAALLEVLGWWSSAAETWARAGAAARAAWPDLWATLELWPAAVEGGRALAPADVAALAGETAARARGLEATPARAAAARAWERTRAAPGFAQVHALAAALGAEAAVELEASPGAPREPSPPPSSAEGEGPAPPALDALPAEDAAARAARARVAAWRSPPPPTAGAPATGDPADGALPARYTAAGWAATSAYLQARLRAATRDGAEQLARARRAFRLALGAGEPAGEAWAGLAWIAAHAADAAAARACLARAAGATPLGRSWAEAALASAEERADAPARWRAAAAAASAGLPDEDRLLGLARRYLVLYDGYLHPPAGALRLALCQDLAALAREAPLSWGLRLYWMHQLEELAGEDEALRKRAKAELDEVVRGNAAALRDQQQVLERLRGEGIPPAEVRPVIWGLLRADPTQDYLLFHDFYNYGAMETAGLEPMLTAFALRPRTTLYRLTSNIYLSKTVLMQLRERGESNFLRLVRVRLTDAPPLLERLPLTAPRALIRPLLRAHQLALGEGPLPSLLADAVASAEAALLACPRLPAAQMLLGLVRTYAGDGAGAREALAAAQAELEVFPGRAPADQRAFDAYLRARTYAGESCLDEAARELRLARQEQLAKGTEWIGDEPLFRLDPRDARSELAEAIRLLDEPQPR
ncbi:MAG: protein kinase [Planctomycetota bacterium]